MNPVPYLHDKVNIIPLIAKADTLTPDECREFKKTVSTSTLLVMKVYSELGLTLEMLSFIQGSHRLEMYLKIQDCLEKALKIKSALKST